MDPSPLQTIPDDNFGPNHVYMATTNIINHQLPHDPTSQPFSVPGPDLDALLKTSLAIDFGSDIAPVAILANMNRLANKGWIINREVLDAFTVELSKYMRCNGYVIHRIYQAYETNS